MDELIKNILIKQSELADNLLACKSNKSAARRARKNTVELDKLYKQFRKESVSNDQHPAAV